MEKKCFLFLLAAAFLVSCENTADDVLNTDDLSSVQEIDMSDFYAYTETTESTLASKGNSNSQKCFTMNHLNIQLDANPGLYKKMYEIEKHTRELINAKKPDGTPGGGNGGGGNGGGGGGDDGGGDPPTDITPSSEFGPKTIPVIFHVIYRSDIENIPDSQLQEQIDALNEDFNLNNPGINTIPSEFVDFQSNIDVNFAIAGIVRTKNKKKRSWRPDDSMKFNSSGGSDVILPEEYLNVWVVNNMPYNGGNILGYAQFPGGDWATDGIVLDHRFTGNTQYSTGRTATHEIGHWMNLRHIWGDGGCSQDDFVPDTPVSDRSNTGCPSYPTVHCSSNDMTMNFMDYSNDPCLNMFTPGQKNRMSPIFASGGFRENMGVSF